MERFFFHLDDGSGEPHDLDGIELENVEAARCQAVELIAETLCNSPKTFWDADSYRVTVTDAAGLTLFSVEMIATLAPAMPNRVRII